MVQEQIKEAYIWSAIYTDGSLISEYDVPGGRGFADVDATRVLALDVVPISQHLPAHRVQVPAGAEPVFFRRRTLTINPNTNEQTPEPTVHCVGWKSEQEAVYLFVQPDGSTLLSNNLQAV